MCQFKSGIILKNKVVLAPEGNDSHSDLLESLGIENDRMNAMKVFVRAELLPPNGNKAVPVDEWNFNVDQDITPDWFDDDRGKYETEFRDAVKEYMKDKIISICGYAWNKVVDGNLTYYFMDGYLDKCEFGKTNNYTDSNVRNMITNSDLAKNLQLEFGDRLVPITLDLLSLDGLDDYGTVTGDILAILTIDLYRKYRKNISKLDSWYWLATPDSTPSGYGSDSVRCVGSNGNVNYFWCGSVKAVRPFFILKSDIFVS